MVEGLPTEQYSEASGMDLSKKGFQRHEAVFWTYRRQPLPNRLTSELPVIQAQSRETPLIGANLSDIPYNFVIVLVIVAS
jgi:hypothetical protein